MPTSARARTPIPTPTARLKTHRSASLRAFGALFVAFAGRSATGTASSSSRANSIVARAMSADREYAGTAVERTTNGRARGEPERERSLQGLGIRGATDRFYGRRAFGPERRRPGKGKHRHCFNDFNHVDATTMSMDDADNENEGRVAGMHRTNALGEGIRGASDRALGQFVVRDILGSNLEPPRDVAHVQFRSKIAWKLVWVPGAARITVGSFWWTTRESSRAFRAERASPGTRDELPNRRRWTVRQSRGRARVVTLFFCTLLRVG